MDFTLSLLNRFLCTYPPPKTNKQQNNHTTELKLENHLDVYPLS